MIKRYFRSLDGKILIAILLAGFFATLVYLLVYRLGSLALSEIYLSPEAVSSRQAELYADFSAYVRENRVAGTDGRTIARWERSSPYLTLVIYRDGEMTLWICDGTVLAAGDMPISERQFYASQYTRLYPIHFADGEYAIAIGDSSDLREDTLNWIVAILLGSVSFVAILLWYIQRLTRRIVRLSREAVAIGGGDLEHPITLKGEDELSMLAREMDNMRRSVIERMGNERRAWEANSELITAISHDIRTPMTSLLGYLSLLDRQGFSQPEQAAQFAASAYDKAMELKDLTDELFRYFLVFGRAQPELAMEELEATLLLQQLLGEAEFDLADAGFSVSRIDLDRECRVRADPMHLKRVLDNLVSNIKKYADPAQPVMVLSEREGDRLSVCLSNHIGPAKARVESTRIGLRTCEKIMAAMGGSFSITRDEEHFAAQFSLPVLAEG